MKTFYRIMVGSAFLLIGCQQVSDDRVDQVRANENRHFPAASDQSPAAIAPGILPKASRQDCTPVWPAFVRLSGVLGTEERFGPPGYGETPEQDERLTIYLLAVDKPLIVCADPDPDQPRSMVENVTRIQLTSIYPTRLQSLVGNRIQVMGSLSHQVWGSDFTDVVFRVTSLRVELEKSL